jgi:small GTP-binding protein
MSISSSALSKKTYKIVLLGDSSTGKTSIIDRFVNNKFELKDNVQIHLWQPTIGIDFLGKNVNHHSSTCRLQLWDTAGQERYRSLIPTYLKDAICAIFVFDLTSKWLPMQGPKPWRTFRVGSICSRTIEERRPLSSSAGTKTIALSTSKVI